MATSEIRSDAKDRRGKIASVEESASAETPAAQMQRHALQMLVGHLPDAVSLHDPEGTYLYASDVFTDAFGWETDQLVGRDCYLLFHPDDIPDIQAVHAKTLDHVRGLSVQYRLRCADGSYKWVETTSRMTPEGNIVAVTRQIADRRSLLHALDNERMVAERLSEIDRERQAFLTAIAHRARHPITAVSGFARCYRLAESSTTTPHGPSTTGWSSTPNGSASSSNWPPPPKSSPAERTHSDAGPWTCQRSFVK